MTISASLGALLKKSFFITPHDDNGRRAVRLKEDKPPKCKVDVFGIPADSIILRSDLYPPPNETFNSTYGECCRADFVIISHSKKLIVFIELKSSKPSKANKVVNQLKGALCFMEYCSIIAFWFCDEMDSLNNYEHRFVCLVAQTQKQTTGTQSGHAGQNTDPRKPKYIYRPTKAQFGSMIS